MRDWGEKPAKSVEEFDEMLRELSAMIPDGKPGYVDVILSVKENSAADEQINAIVERLYIAQREYVLALIAACNRFDVGKTKAGRNAMMEFFLYAVPGLVRGAWSAAEAARRIKAEFGEEHARLRDLEPGWIKALNAGLETQEVRFPALGDALFDAGRAALIAEKIEEANA